jgi:hypothetical protein
MASAPSFPLSDPQSTALRQDTVRARNGGYGDHRFFRVTGPLDLDALRTTLVRLVERHEPLRTVYRGDRQYVLDAMAVPLREHRTADAIELAVRLATEPYRLDLGPLLRVHVIRGGGETWLLLCLHLLVLDGWGLNTFTAELSAVYREQVTGAPAALPELRVQYVDWAAWQRAQLSDDRRTRLLDWWRTAVDGYPRLLRLPVSPTAVAGPVGRRRYRELDGDDLASVGRLARAARTTEHVVMVTMFAITLARHTGQRRLLVGTPQANRDHPDTHGLLGFFVDLMVLPVDLSGDLTFHGALDRVAETSVAVHRHRDLPFDQLVSGLGEPVTPDRSPLVQAVFVHRPDGSLGSLDFAGCRVEDVPLDVPRTRFEFSLRIDGPTVCLEYDSSLFDAHLVEAFLDDYLRVLRSVKAHETIDIDAVDS